MIYSHTPKFSISFWKFFTIQMSKPRISWNSTTSVFIKQLMVCARKKFAILGISLLLQSCTVRIDKFVSYESNIWTNYLKTHKSNSSTVYQTRSYKFPTIKSIQFSSRLLSRSLFFLSHCFHLEYQAIIPNYTNLHGKLRFN